MPLFTTASFLSPDKTDLHMSANCQLGIAKQRSRSSIRKEDRMQAQTKTGYSLLQITLHWLVALLVMFQLVFGESMTTVVDAAEEGTAVSPLDQTLATAHYWVGISILSLVIIRLAVRLAQGAPEVVGPASWMTLAAKAVHVVFYLLLAAVPITGLLTTYVSGEFGDIHSLAKPAFIVLILAHAGAALFHHFFLKDGTLKRMLVPARG
jgi:cytochrome b561